jgi:aspartyl-tRNA(Asn)/glutamyl-tRNA(Gln) amidotransferase subunit B
LLVAERAIADYFEAAAELGREKDVHPQEISNWMLGELFRLLNERNVSIQNAQATPQHLVSLIALRQAETINANAAKRVLQEIFETGEDPQAVVDRLGLAQISDTDALFKVVAEVIDANPDQVEQYLGGKTAVSGWFIGQVMRATRGKANPQEVRDLIVTYLEQKRSC